MIRGKRKARMKAVVASIGAFSLAMLLMGPCGLLERSALAAAYTFRATTNVNSGDVVIWDSGTDRGVRTTNASGSDYVAGVAAETVSAGNDCAIRQDGGRVTVNVTGSVDPTVNPWLVTSSVTGKAQGVSSLESDGIFARAITSDGTPAAGQVYATVDLGFLGYGPGGIDDDIPDTGDWTEAQMELSLSDVTDVFTSNDGALNEDDVTLADIQTAASSDFHNIGGVDDDIPDAGDWTEADLESSLSDATDVITNNDMIGTSFPGSPSEGDLFYHSTYNIQFQHDGASWIPVRSFGALALYVDSGSGSDIVGQGYGAAASATATVQYCIDNCVPAIFGGDVTINISAATYNEDVVIKGKNPSGDFVIKLAGVFSQQLAEQTVSSGVQGTGATQGSVTVTAAGWSANAYDDMWIVFESDTTTTALQNDIHVIDSNTSDTITAVGCFDAQPVSGDTFRVWDQGTVIDTVTVAEGQVAVTLEKIHVLLDATNHTIWGKKSTTELNYCKVSHASGAICVADFHAEVTSSRSVYSKVRVNVTGSKWRSYGDKFIDGYSTCLLQFQNMAFGSLSQGTVIDANSSGVDGVFARYNSMCGFYSAAASGYVRVRNADQAGDVGINVDYGSGIGSPSNIQYSNNTTNSDVDTNGSWTE